MRDVILFGAGAQGRTAAAVLMNEGHGIKCFIDNNSEKQGQSIMDIPIISLDTFLREMPEEEIIVSVGTEFQGAIIEQLRDKGISNVRVFNKELLLKKERFLSYSYPTEHEDLILFHVLKDEKEIFWIDVGCNDPDLGSVTKAFYERGHHGINIDMEKGMVDITEKERPRDINIHAGIGSKEGEGQYYSQGDWGGLSTMVEGNRLNDSEKAVPVKITTLKRICEEYATDTDISFLKIDVEGMEKEVLEGMDFEHYRPKIIVMESTLPCTDIPNYEEWEDFLLKADYHFAYMHGINRYYVADERKELDARFEPWEKLAGRYCILHADILYAV